MFRRKVIIILIVVVLAGVALRSYGLTARSLWFDEAFSWRLVQFDFNEMIARDVADVHPPLYYVLLKGWTTIFAASLLSLRSFSVFFAGLTIAACYGLTSFAFRSRLAGLLAAALLALSGWQIQFAWEARMYTLGTFLTLLSSWFLLLAIRRNKVIDWLLYALTTVAFLYVHYYAFFFLAAQVLFISGYFLVKTRARIGEMLQSKSFWLAGGALVLVGVLFAPWLPVFLAQNSRVQQSYWIPKIGGWSIPDTFYRMYVPTALIPRHTGGWWALAVLPIVFSSLLWLLLVPVFKRGTSDKKPAADAAWLVLLSGVVPFCLSVGLSFWGQSLYQDRFFVFAHLFIIIALAALISRLPFRYGRYGVILIVVVGFLAAYVSYWTEIDIKSKPGVKAAVAEVAQKIEPGDKVIVSSPFIYFAVLYYASEEHGLLVRPKLYSTTGQLSHFAGGPILTKEDIVGPKVFDQTSRLWVVDTTGFGSERLELPPDWRLFETTSFPEVFTHQGEVLLGYYTKRNSR